MSLNIQRGASLNWESLDFRLYFTGDLTDGLLVELNKLISSWYMVASYSGFGGVTHYLSDIGIEADLTASYVEWWVDMGSAGETAITAIGQCLHTFCRVHNVSFERLVLGHESL